MTFLFTDVQGSTRLLERHPEAYRGAIAQHPAILAEAITQSHGLIFETAHLAESLEIFKDLGDRRGIAFVLEGFAGLAADEAQPLRAHCLAASAATLRRIIGAGPPPAWRADLERSLEAASRGLGGDSIEEASARGRLMTLAEAMIFALAEPPLDRPRPPSA